MTRNVGQPGAKRLAERNAIVTGAASGIGQAIALRLLAEGARVLATDRVATGLQQTRQSCAPIDRDRLELLDVDLADDAVIKRRFLLPPADGVANYRYVIDLASKARG